MRILHLFLVVSVPLMVTFCGNDDTGESREQRTGRTIELTDKVKILSEQQDQTITEVRVALARTESERNAGLMDVHDLPFDAGMYFIFEEETPRSFWMANTPLPLDILFISRDHRIVRIHTRTTPYSDRPIRSEQPAMYTLEVNAGFVSEHDIREGMYVKLK